MPYNLGMAMGEIVNLARTRAKSQFGFDIPLSPLKLLTTCMASKGNSVDSFVWRDTPLLA